MFTGNITPMGVIFPLANSIETLKVRKFCAKFTMMNELLDKKD